MSEHVRHHDLPAGAQLTPEGVLFRVWAPERRRVEVVIEDDARTVLLHPSSDGYHEATVPNVAPGTRYRLLIDGRGPFPDPMSRFQPDGPHGPSQVIDPSAFRWTDGAWRGPAEQGNVIYEMHVATFTREGTWRAASRHLAALADIGITIIEMMPVAEFGGRFGWGYDGVDLFAPTRLYGEPDDLRAFIDHAHSLGLAVILDVVYNHLGPEGNYLKEFTPHYFTTRYRNEWGDPLNFDGPHSNGVRDFFIANAGYWVSEYHFDGLRLDATQQIFDASSEHIVTAITRFARESARDRNILIIGENEPQRAHLVADIEDGGCGLDALWNDDFHHSLRVALTGRNEAYFSNYSGTPQEMVSAAKHGFLYQGQYYPWQRQRRGSPAYSMPSHAFVIYAENHDQIANSARGARLRTLTSPGRWRAATALLLLSPGTPMLFQGQEFNSSRPFFYFADHNPDLAARVRSGRHDFLRQFPSIASEEMQSELPDPSADQTFEACILDDTERSQNASAIALHRDLLSIRRHDPAFDKRHRRGIDGAVLSEECFALRFFVDDARDRLLLVNFGRDLAFSGIAEPLLAPPLRMRWHLLWSSEDPQYGGSGCAALDDEATWKIPGHAAVLLAPQRREDDE